MNKERSFFGKATGLMLLAGAGISAHAIEHVLDLTSSGVEQGTLTGVTGGTAIFSRSQLQPTGTGVFQPFFTVKSKGNNTVEEGYNTTAFKLPLDDLRPPWNNPVRLGDIGSVDINGHSYFVFTLDANEPGNDERFLSIDNIRIYTAPDSGDANTTHPDDLGTLRFALNPLSKTPGVLENWVKIDASLAPNRGSGDSDMYAYIPTDNFAGLDPDLSVYFYNLNGAHIAATSGFEEWKVDPPAGPSVPETGGTLVTLSLGLLGLGLISRRPAAKARQPVPQETQS